MISSVADGHDRFRHMGAPETDVIRVGREVDQVDPPRKIGVDRVFGRVAEVERPVRQRLPRDENQRDVDARIVPRTVLLIFRREA